MATVEEYQSIPIEQKLRRAAHHEAGHIVVAGHEGLALSPDGISIDPSGQGLACYWKEPEDNDASRIKVIHATFAGFKAEEQYCRLYSLPTLDESIDTSDSFEARKHICRLSNLGSTTVWSAEELLKRQSQELVEKNWAAIEAVASALISKDWEPLRVLKSGALWAEKDIARYLGGEEIILLLHGFDIATTCKAE